MSSNAAEHARGTPSKKTNREQIKIIPKLMRTEAHLKMSDTTTPSTTLFVKVDISDI